MQGPKTRRSIIYANKCGKSKKLKTGRQGQNRKVRQRHELGTRDSLPNYTTQSGNRNKGKWAGIYTPGELTRALTTAEDDCR